jgi:hypothetical protein
MGICGWICTVIIFIALCVTAQSMFEDYLSYKSEKFDNDEEDEEKED